MKSKILVTVFLFMPGSAVLAADDGKTLSASCAGCHGSAGKSVGAMPTLAGLEKAYVVKQMQDFKSGKRPATIMHQLAKGYSDEQIEAMAAFFAQQKAK